MNTALTIDIQFFIFICTLLDLPVQSFQYSLLCVTSISVLIFILFHKSSVAFDMTFCFFLTFYIQLIFCNRVNYFFYGLQFIAE